MGTVKRLAIGIAITLFIIALPFLFIAAFAAGIALLNTKYGFYQLTTAVTSHTVFPIFCLVLMAGAALIIWQSRQNIS